MARFYGIIGFVETVEEPEGSGIYTAKATEHSYFGDVTRNTRRLQTIDQLNDDVVISNEISIVADQFAYEHFHAIRYAEYLGTKWKVTNVEVQTPRLILTMGGVYNG